MYDSGPFARHDQFTRQLIECIGNTHSLDALSSEPDKALNVQCGRVKARLGSRQRVGQGHGVGNRRAE